MDIKRLFTATGLRGGSAEARNERNRNVQRNDWSARRGRLRTGGKAADRGREIPQVKLEALAREAHEKICPYSHATRGNIQVDLAAVGA